MTSTGGDSVQPCWDEMLVMLLDEPYLLRFHEIADLTPRQVFDYYFRPRDDKGVPLPLRGESSASPTVNTDDPEVQRRMWMDIGRQAIKGGKANFTEAELIAAWDEGERRRIEREAKEKGTR